MCDLSKPPAVSSITDDLVDSWTLHTEAGGLAERTIQEVKTSARTL